MVVGSGLKAKYGLGKAVLDFERLCLGEQPFKSFTGVFKNQSLEECFSGGCAKNALCLSLAISMPTMRYSSEPRISFLSV